MLAREDAWAHATGAPEVGGLLLATPEAPRLIGEEYWQARRSAGEASQGRRTAMVAAQLRLQAGSGCGGRR